MSVQSNPSKREMIQGLRKRPTYDNVVEIMIKDKVIKLPNRDAKFLRESPAYTRLDNMTAFESMQQQQMETLREQQKENVMRRAAAEDPSIGMANIRATEPARQRTPEFYDIGVGGEHMSEGEEEIAQHIQQEYQQTRVRQDKLKRKTRTHLVLVRPRESELMRPETAEIGVNTSPTTGEMGTQTDDIGPPPPPPPGAHINKKIKSLIKEAKAKQERKTRKLKEELTNTTQRRGNESRTD